MWIQPYQLTAFENQAARCTNKQLGQQVPSEAVYFRKQKWQFFSERLSEDGVNK